jgi:hypothetical protein
MAVEIKSFGRRKTINVNDSGPHGARTIVTDYFEREGADEVIKRTYSKDPIRAIMNASAYMSTDKFGATVVQILEADGSRIYSEMVINKDGKLETTLDFNKLDYVTPSSLKYFKTTQKRERARKLAVVK